MGLKQKETSRSFLTLALNILCSGKRPAKSITPPEHCQHHLQPEIPPKSDSPVPAQSFSLFLDLPRELRDKIYEIRLLIPLPARPTSHPEAIRRALAEPLPTWSFQCLQYSPDPPHLTSLPLLLCNRQIKGEVQDAMARLEKQHALRYILDCELIGERYIYPTWLLLPVFTKHVPFVYVNLRSTGMAYPSYHRGWLGNGGPPSMIWALLDLLQKFSAHGPHFAATSPKRKDVFIDTLVLDVLSCGNNLPDDDCAARVQEPIARPNELDTRSRWDSRPSSRQVDPNDPAVVEALLKYVSWMFIDERDTTPHAKNVAKVVKKIHLLHDGVQVGAWDTQSYEHLR